MAYLEVVDRSILPILPLLALAVMGNSCQFGASVNAPPPSREGEETSDREGSGDGLLIVVRSGDSVDPPSAQTATASDSLVAEALAMSALASPAYAPGEPDLASDGAGVAASTSITSRPGLAAPIAMTSAEPATPVGAVPEPTGLLLFVCGLAVAGAGSRSGSRSRSPRTRYSSASGGSSGTASGSPVPGSP